MLTEDGKFQKCDFPIDCSANVPNHRWGSIKAEGWGFTKAGKAYCPEHSWKPKPLSRIDKKAKVI